MTKPKTWSARTFGNEPEAPDIREGRDFRRLEDNILDCLRFGKCCVRVLLDRLCRFGFEDGGPTIHYRVGLALESLCAENLVSVDDSNPLISKYALGGNRREVVVTDYTRWTGAENGAKVTTPESVEEITCSKCGETKAPEKFYREVRMRSGRQTQCKDCKREINRLYRRARKREREARV